MVHDLRRAPAELAVTTLQDDCSPEPEHELELELELEVNLRTTLDRRVEW